MKMKEGRNEKGGWGFSVPEGYFDAFPDKMHRKVSVSPSKLETLALLLKRPQLVGTFIVLLMTVAVIWVVQVNNSKEETLPLAMVKEKVDSVVVESKGTNISENKEVKKSEVNVVSSVSNKSFVVGDTTTFIPIKEEMPELAVNTNQDLELLLDEGIDEDLLIEELLRD